ncbi:hypothetical protein WK66_29385 [Burkholderia ubonensis]|nr:hypothetical protein WK66_29385 [Burkholderia ubonensis]
MDQRLSIDLFWLREIRIQFEEEGKMTVVSGRCGEVAAARAQLGEELRECFASPFVCEQRIRLGEFALGKVMVITGQARRGAVTSAELAATWA